MPTSVRSLAKPVDPVHPGQSCGKVLDRFLRDAELYCVPVVADSKPIALIDREQFVEFFSRRYMLDLYGARNIAMLLANEDYAARTWFGAEAGRLIDDVARDIASKGTRLMAEGFLVTENGAYLGVANGRDVLRRIAERNVDILRDSESLHRGLTEFFASFAWKLDENLRFTEVHGRAFDELGLARDDLIGLTTQDIAARIGAEPVSMSWEKYAELRERRLPYRDVRLRVRRGDGAEIFLSLWGEPTFDREGRFVGYRGITQNVTERIALERALAKANRELESANRRLEDKVEERTRELLESNRQLEAFTQSVAHDLRAPLRAINSFAQMLLDREAERLSESGRRRLAQVKSSALQMAGLIEGLLAFARLGVMEVKRSHVPMRALCESVVEDLRQEYGRAEIALAALPDAQGDPGMLRQVLVNLLGNACKYSAKRDHPRIEVGWDGALEAWFVRDNGAGFDMQHAQKLFGAFERLHAESEFPGVGIGLAMVRRIVERHGGRVWAEAKPDAGATFFFTLTPAARPKAYKTA